MRQKVSGTAALLNNGDVRHCPWAVEKMATAARRASKALLLGAILTAAGADAKEEKAALSEEEELGEQM